MERSSGLSANDSHPFCIAAHQSLGHPSQELLRVVGERALVGRVLPRFRAAAYPLDFDIRDFDVSPDRGEVVLERGQERSNVVLLDLPRP